MEDTKRISSRVLINPELQTDSLRTANPFPSTVMRIAQGVNGRMLRCRTSDGPSHGGPSLWWEWPSLQRNFLDKLYGDDFADFAALLCRLLERLVCRQRLCRCSPPPPRKPGSNLVTCEAETLLGGEFLSLPLRETYRHNATVTMQYQLTRRARVEFKESVREYRREPNKKTETENAKSTCDTKSCS